MNIHHQCKGELADDCQPSKNRVTKGYFLHDFLICFVPFHMVYVGNVFLIRMIDKLVLQFQNM